MTTQDNTDMLRWDEMDEPTHAWWSALKVGDCVTVNGEPKTISCLPLSTSPYPTASFSDGSWCYAGAIDRAR